jgi:hypothetical protein
VRKKISGVKDSTIKFSKFDRAVYQGGEGDRTLLALTGYQILRTPLTAVSEIDG